MQKKRYLSFILSVAMLLVMLPVNIRAEETDKNQISYDASSEQITDVIEDLPDNEELFAGYVDELFFGSYGISAFGNYADDMLEGVDLNAYHVLKDRIEKVAAGELSSTVFELSLEDLGITKTEWSAADLGVESIVEETAEGLAIAQAAVNALDQQITPNLNKMQNYLLIDCPLDLYWFDKTNGIMSSGIRFKGSNKNGEWLLETTTNLTYSFAVAEEYQNKNAADAVHTVNTSLVQSAQAAVDCAKAIVKKYAYYSDYDKLNAYREEICNLVEYNHDAVDNNAAYGNPWQLIWVFDGDESTNVVCEGYSKAFQYLCDLSEFIDSNVRCYTVTGTMDGGTGAGGHMWNVVTMDDAKNYIVDVTNCDSGSIGADDKLFLAGAEGSVSSGYRVTISGMDITYEYDASMLTMYGDILSLASENFTYDYMDGGKYGDSGISWNLDRNGFLNIKGSGEMPNADAIDDYEAIPWYDYQKDIKRVVVQEGITSVSRWAFFMSENVTEISLPESLTNIGEAAFAGSNIGILEFPESLQSIGALAFYYCNNLTEIEIPENVSVIGPGAFLECSSLKNIYIEPNNSSYVFEDGILYNKDKTKVIFCIKTKSGAIELPESVTYIEAYAFSGCSNIFSVTIPESVTYIGMEAFKDCPALIDVYFIGDCPTFEKVSDEEESERNTAFDESTPTIYCSQAYADAWSALAAADFSNALTVKTACADGNHVWDTDYTVERGATCKEDGIISIHCTICGKGKDYETQPGEHQYGEWIAVTSPTCTQAGEQKRICSVCGNIDTEEIPAASHDWNSEYTIDQAATCTTEGMKSIHCKNCNEVTDSQPIPAARHNLVKQTSGNSTYDVCTICGEIFNEKSVTDLNPSTEQSSGTTVGPSADQPGISSKKVEKISITAVSKNIAAGKKISLKAEISPEDADNTNVKWESDNTKYATVNSKGVVSTKKAGQGKTVTITATALDGSGVSASVKLKVMKNAVTKVQITNAPKTVQAGKSISLKTAVSVNGKKVNNKLQWISSNEQYATVNAKGKVKTKKAGKGKTVTITAVSTDGTNKKAKVRIKIA